jgi:hypothetical protein
MGRFRREGKCRMREEEEVKIRTRLNRLEG